MCRPALERNQKRRREEEKERAWNGGDQQKRRTRFLRMQRSLEDC
jgi:hypothetical protein